MDNIIEKKTINKKLVNDMLEKNLETGQFTNYGPNTKLLEEYIKSKLIIDQDRDVILVNNGSIAIHILTNAIEYYHKDININWATQSFTFPPSSQANLINCEILDIDLEGGLNIEEVTNNLNGLIVTNIFGNCVDISKYEDFCSKNNKYLIFDNAASSYTFYKNKNINNYGEGCTISFHHTKPFGFGEGGAIILKKKYYDITRKLINFGINLEEDVYYNRLGNNGKISEISSVYIYQYLYDNFDKIVNVHKELYEYLKNKIKEEKITKFKLFPSFHDGNNIVPNCFCLIFKKYDKSIEKKFINNNIFFRKYYNPLKNTKNSINLYNSILCFPCNSNMKKNDIDKLISLIV